MPHVCLLGRMLHSCQACLGHLPTRSLPYCHRVPSGLGDPYAAGILEPNGLFLRKRLPVRMPADMHVADAEGAHAQHSSRRTQHGCAGAQGIQTAGEAADGQVQVLKVGKGSGLCPLCVRPSVTGWAAVVC